MSINALLGTGLSALLANQAALRTTASNISNVNTPDYVRRVVGFKTQAPGGVLGGVDLGAVTRAVDLFLNAERLNASSGAGESDAADRFLDQLQKAMGGVAEGRDDQVAQRVEVVQVDRVGADLEPDELATAGDGGLDEASARTAGESRVGQFVLSLLQLLLHRLRLLEQRIHVQAFGEHSGSFRGVLLTGLVRR